MSPFITAFWIVAFAAFGSQDFTGAKSTIPCVALRQALQPKLQSLINDGDRPTLAFLNSTDGSVTADADQLKSMISDNRQDGVGWSGLKPSSEARNTAGSSHLVSAFECSGVSDLIGATPILGLDETRVQLNDTVGRQRSPLFISMTAPAVAKDGNSAIVLLQVWGNSLGGSEEAIYLVKKDGRWEQVGGRRFSES